MNTKFAIGALTWDAEERRSQRYGYVYIGAESCNGNPICSHSIIDVAPLKPLMGERVKIVAKVLETRKSEHWGDRFLDIEPTTPEVSEEIVLGIGKFTVQLESMAVGGISFGVEPSESRANYWLDPRTLYRLHEQTVELYIEPTDEADLPKTTLQLQVDPDVVISNGDETFQALGTCPERILPEIENLGDGMSLLHMPTCGGNAGKQFKRGPTYK